MTLMYKKSIITSPETPTARRRKKKFYVVCKGEPHVIKNNHQIVKN